jgi:hypothetical protein
VGRSDIGGYEICIYIFAVAGKKTALHVFFACLNDNLTRYTCLDLTL